MRIAIKASLLCLIAALAACEDDGPRRRNVISLVTFSVEDLDTNTGIQSGVGVTLDNSHVPIDPDLYLSIVNSSKLVKLPNLEEIAVERIDLNHDSDQEGTVAPSIRSYRLMPVSPLTDSWHAVLLSADVLPMGSGYNYYVHDANRYGIRFHPISHPFTKHVDMCNVSEGMTGVVLFSESLVLGDSADLGLFFRGIGLTERCYPSHVPARSRGLQIYCPNLSRDNTEFVQTTGPMSETGLPLKSWDGQPEWSVTPRLFGGAGVPGGCKYWRPPGTSKY